MISFEEWWDIWILERQNHPSARNAAHAAWHSALKARAVWSEADQRDAALWRDLVLLDQMDLMVIFGGAGSNKELLSKLAEWIERKRPSAPDQRPKGDEQP